MGCLSFPGYRALRATIIALILHFRLYLEAAKSKRDPYIGDKDAHHTSKDLMSPSMTLEARSIGIK